MYSVHIKRKMESHSKRWKRWKRFYEETGIDDFWLRRTGAGLLGMYCEKQQAEKFIRENEPVYTSQRGYDHYKMGIAKIYFPNRWRYYACLIANAFTK